MTQNVYLNTGEQDIIMGLGMIITVLAIYTILTLLVKHNEKNQKHDDLKPGHYTNHPPTGNTTLRTDRTYTRQPTTKPTYKCDPRTHTNMTPKNKTNTPTKTNTNNLFQNPDANHPEYNQPLDVTKSTPFQRTPGTGTP